MTSWPGGIWAAQTHVALPLLGHQISRENSTSLPIKRKEQWDFRQEPQRPTFQNKHQDTWSHKGFLCPAQYKGHSGSLATKTVLFPELSSLYGQNV